MAPRLPGKKVDVLEIKTATRTHKVDLRFDRETSKFLAYFGDTRFDAETPKEIADLVKAEAEKLDKVKWQRWIDIDLDVHGSNYRSSADLEMWLKNPDMKVEGFSLRFSAYDITPAWDEQDEPDQRRNRQDRYRAYMRQDLREENDGELSNYGQPSRHVIYPHQEITEGSDGMVPWTPERWAALLEIRRAIKELVRNVHQLFKDPDAAIASLAAVTRGEQLLITDGKKRKA